MVPWGAERGWPTPKRGERCDDCGVLPGGFHHLGCDIQECPCCRRQLLSCGCRYEELALPAEWDDEEDEW